MWNMQYLIVMFVFRFDTHIKSPERIIGSHMCQETDPEYYRRGVILYKYADISHQFDVWHFVKNITNCSLPQSQKGLVL